MLQRTLVVIASSLILLLCMVPNASAAQRSRPRSSPQGRKAQASPIQQEGYRQAQRVWDSMATKCGDSYYGIFRQDAIYEFKDVAISVNAERLSEADRLNGIEWRGTASFNPKVFRETTDRGEWGPWRNGGGVATYSLQTLGMAVWMRKQNGQWSVEHTGQPFLFGTLKRIGCFEVPGLSPVPASSTVPSLRDKFRNDFLNAANLSDATYALNRLLKLGWGTAEPVLLEILKSRPKFFLEVVPHLAEHRSQRAVPLIVAVLKSQFDNKDTRSACKKNPRLLAGALATVGKTDSAESVEVLKQILSAAISDHFRRIIGNYAYVSQKTDTDCVDEYLSALASLDDPSWRSFSYWHPRARNVFGSILYDLSRQRHMSGFIDRTSANVREVSDYLERLKPCKTPASWKCPSMLIAERITIYSPSKVAVSGSLEEYEQTTGAWPVYTSELKTVDTLTVYLRATSNTETPWLVEDISRSGKNQAQPANQYPERPRLKRRPEETTSPSNASANETAPVNTDPISGMWDAIEYLPGRRQRFTLILKAEEHNITGQKISQFGTDPILSGVWIDNPSCDLQGTRKTVG